MVSCGAKLDVSGGKIIIGDRCTNTNGCIILSHDRSKKRINSKDKGKGTVRLGNDVFIGVNSVVLRNETIGRLFNSWCWIRRYKRCTAQ